MDYKTLYNKYIKLIEENEKLKKEIAFLKKYDKNPLKLIGDVIINNEKITEDYCWEGETFKVDVRSTPEQKIALFKELFAGRKDVYAKRWTSKKGKSGYSPVCLNEWISGVCNKPESTCSVCHNKNYAEFNKQAIEQHLRGYAVYGIYPLLQSETCKFVAIDFDKHDWKEDIKIIREVCNESHIPVAIERSRSGNGAHAWIFFQDELSASLARKLGTAIITYSMSIRHEIKFQSYDRIFPNQDTMPKGGFGNLIALPLQKKARKYYNSEFINEDFNSYNDQWKYLSSIRKMSEEEVENSIIDLCKGNEYGTLKDEDSENKPWIIQRPQQYELSIEDFPSKVQIVLANGIYIKKEGFSHAALNKIKRLAAFKNPEFFKAQAMRLPTYNKPRIIDLSEENLKYLFIPRGCLQDLQILLSSFELEIEYVDERQYSRDIDVSFKGELRDKQKEVVKMLLAYNQGVLSATTAFGKTVIGAYLMASRKKNALIIVHTRQLLEQWQERLNQFLIINEELPKEKVKKRGKAKSQNIIGQIGGGKNRPNGIIDIALMQSLIKDKEVKDFIREYGFVIVDECHHVPAFTFEQIMKNIHAKYVYGLTATPIRKDGHQPIIFMQCGQIRSKVDAKEESKKRSFEHFITPRFTSFRRLKDSNEDERYNITSIYAELVENELRNSMIVEDIIKAVNEGRNPIVLTERTNHVDILVKMLNNRIDHVIQLTGNMSTRKRREELERLSKISLTSNFVIVATGKFVGEGFDEPRLDTLFLAMPIAWKGTVVQYAGRLHRELDNKSEVIIYDYVDIHIPVLEKMYQKRLKAYASIGYKSRGEKIEESINAIYDQNTFFEVFRKDICNAISDILIVSPFISKRRLMSMIRLLTKEINGGVNIVIVTRPKTDFKEKDHQTYDANMKILFENGIKVDYKSNIHQKFAIIDQKVVWYGSINLLSYGRDAESIMRLSSLNIANELLASIEN
jgi:superfamily II DNA or RNA helicase